MITIRVVIRLASPGVQLFSIQAMSSSSSSSAARPAPTRAELEAAFAFARPYFQHARDGNVDQLRPAIEAGLPPNLTNDKVRRGRLDDQNRCLSLEVDDWEYFGRHKGRHARDACGVSWEDRVREAVAQARRRSKVSQFSDSRSLGCDFPYVSSLMPVRTHCFSLAGLQPLERPRPVPSCRRSFQKRRRDHRPVT